MYQLFAMLADFRGHLVWVQNIDGALLATLRPAADEPQLIPVAVCGIVFPGTAGAVQEELASQAAGHPPAEFHCTLAPAGHPGGGYFALTRLDAIA
jgi:hypothetical protein